jgi:hypothetical protein
MGSFVVFHTTTVTSSLPLPEVGDNQNPEKAAAEPVEVKANLYWKCRRLRKAQAATVAACTTL